MTDKEVMQQALEQPVQEQQQAEPPPEWLLIKNILDEYGLQAIDFVAEFKAAQQVVGVTHCQCEACKNGNIHDSDCSVHNGDALPVGPCDCSLATPPLPVQEPLEYWNAVEGWVKIDEVREHFDSVGCGTIYKNGGEGRVPLYTAPPQQQAEPVAWDKPSASFNEWWDSDRHDGGNPFQTDSFAYWAWAGWKAAQRPWVDLTNGDWEWVADKKETSLDTFAHGAAWAADQLKEKNT